MTTLLEQASLHAFIALNGVRTETGDILDFKKYRFMFDIYADRSALLCCMKAAQIGFTTFEILKTAHECKFERHDIIYVLPTFDDVKRFSGGKTNKILAQNPLIAQWTKDKDSVEQKQFGQNTVYYLGSWTENPALMITAKKLVIDEYDRCKPAIVEMYDSRLQSVANPKKAFFSNPSEPDFGIDKWYKKSDQKKWHITHACGETYIMDESCVDYQAQIYRCPRCQGEITDEDRRMGEWIATSKGEWSGYWIPLWIAPWMSAKNIAQYKQEKSPEYFANFVAGLPYIGAGNTVSAQTIVKCLNPDTNDQEDRIIIGVDTGLPIHIVMANAQGFFYYDTLPALQPYLKFEEYLKRWPKCIIVADQGGDLIGIRDLQAKYPGRVFLVWYRRDRKTLELIKWGENEEYGNIVADRNRMIQLVIDEMVDRRITFNGTESEWQEYITHWLNIYRHWQKDDSGEIDKTLGFTWKRQGPDHYVHATVYARIGLSKYARTMATIVGDNAFAGVKQGKIVQPQLPHPNEVQRISAEELAHYRMDI